MCIFNWPQEFTINICICPPHGGFAPCPPRLRRDRIFQMPFILQPPAKICVWRLNPQAPPNILDKMSNPQALLRRGSSPLKPSSSRARVPQGLLKPSSRRVKDSLKKPSPIQECASIHTVDWSSTTHTSVNSCPVTGTNRFSRHASRYSSRYVWHASTTSRRIHRMRYWRRDWTYSRGSYWILFQIERLIRATSCLRSRRWTSITYWI